MRRIAALSLALVLAACSGSPAPESAPAVLPDGVTPVPAPPVTALIGQREELALTSAQVVALDSIGQALREQNAPFEDRVRDTREAWGGRMGARDRRLFMDQVGPALAAIYDNNRRAGAAVGEVLTPEQRAEACELVRARREALFRERRGGYGDERPERLTPRTARRRDVDPDTLLVRRAPALPWCGGAGAASASLRPPRDRHPQASPTRTAGAP